MKSRPGNKVDYNQLRNCETKNRQLENDSRGC